LIQVYACLCSSLLLGKRGIALNISIDNGFKEIKLNVKIFNGSLQHQNFL
jgi:hypothetical protein